ncbi:FG-GAP repeat domain-containing protein [Longispora albida]|uniref:FG-GAP repeat domain-containing protein n=1 Tax=Longispora albida TaxID=203523 RepID=UPI00039B904B|nr:VCBS repeat-containing protein [Longispora albida]
MKALRFSMVAAVLATGLAPVPAYAQSAVTPFLYVSNTGVCSDTPGGEAGTEGMPFCTIQRAADVVQPGQTVRIAQSYKVYPGDFTLTRSGTPEAPIIFEADPKSGGQQVRVQVIDNAPALAAGLHDVRLRNFWIEQKAGLGPALSFSEVSNVVLESSFVDLQVLVSQSAGVRVERSYLDQGIQVSGGSADTVLTTNVIRRAKSDLRPTVLLKGAARTTVTSNTVSSTPVAAGVVASQDSTFTNNYFPPDSFEVSRPVVEVDAASAATTKASYSGFGTALSPQVLYRWAGTDYATVAAFQAGTGQGASDVTENAPVDQSLRTRGSSYLPYELVDSANPDAPGQLGTDIAGNPRIRNHSAPAGRPAIHDRGAYENVPLSYSSSIGNTYLAATREMLTVEWSGLSYYGQWGSTDIVATYEWGDGTTSSVTTRLPWVAAGEFKETTLNAARHRYQLPGTYQVKVSLTVPGWPKVLASYTMGADVNPVNMIAPHLTAASDAGQVKADFNGDGRDDLVVWEAQAWPDAVPVNPKIKLMLGKDGGFEAPQGDSTWQASAYWRGRVKSLTAGDYNGDGKAEMGLLVEQPNGYTALHTLSYNTTTRTFDGLKLAWEAPYWGTGTRFASTGDFNGDGKADLALYYQYSGSHASIFTLNGSADGTLGSFKQQWDAPLWGTGTQSMSAGDFNGDGRSDLALFYHYGGSHVAAFTLTADANGTMGGLYTRWNAPQWGSATKFVKAGNFTGDAKSDLALFYDYGDGRVTAFSLTAGADGGFTALETIWNGPYWGSGTKHIAAGKYTTSTGRSDLALLYDYGNMVQTLFAFTPQQAGGFQGPRTMWSQNHMGASYKVFQVL